MANVVKYKVEFEKWYKNNSNFKGEINYNDNLDDGACISIQAQEGYPIIKAEIRTEEYLYKFFYNYKLYPSFDMSKIEVATTPIESDD